MTRISNFAQTQALLAQLMQTQSAMSKTQGQISSGKKATQFKELARDLPMLMLAKGLESRVSQYLRIGQEVKARLDLQEVHLEGIASQSGEMRQAIMDALSMESGLGLMEKVQAVFRSTVNSLNTMHDGGYLFAGSRSDMKPVAGTTYADLLAAADADELFNDLGRKSRANIDDSFAIEYGFLANELGADLFASLKRIAEYHEDPATGPFGEHLTQAQRDFLQTEVQALIGITQDLNSQVARNGLMQKELDTVMTRHKDVEIYVKSFIGDIEDVDMAEAITRLNSDQLTLEASTRVLATLNRITLLDYI